MLKGNLFKMYYSIVIWYKPKTNEYYYKKIKYSLTNYYVGFTNSYGHEVIMIIELNDLFVKNSLKQKLITKAIRFLERIK